MNARTPQQAKMYQNCGQMYGGMTPLRQNQFEPNMFFGSVSSSSPGTLP